MASIQDLQQAAYGDGHDYASGSPHIRHHALRTWIVETLQDVVRDVEDRRGSCHVLEVGAGHGTFTDHLVAAGATVEVTEMSLPSVVELQARFRHNKAVAVVHDPDGLHAQHGGSVDVVACVSVLHHMPDYLSAVRRMLSRVAPGGAFVSFQDPLLYARRSAMSRRMERAAYLSWRITQGELRRGLATTIRRVRGELDENNPSDMVEYHVVRDGVDERALLAYITPSFTSASLRTYWSSQGPVQQTLGARVMRPNTFGIVATGALIRHGSTEVGA